MTQQEWESYISKMITKVKREAPRTKEELRAFLSENDYTKNSRSFVNEYAGGASTRGTQVSVDKTVKRMNKKIRENQQFLRRRGLEISAGKYQATINHIDTYTNQLRKRARTILDANELARTKADLKKMIDLQKRVRRANQSQLPGVLRDAVSVMGDIRYSSSLRSSMNSQVKGVAISERTFNKGKDFYGNVKTDKALIDVVLSSRHVIYDICDEVANAGPYTKDNLPALGLHTKCRCRYHRHSEKTSALNKQRAGKGSKEKSKIVPQLAKDVYSNR